MVNGLPDATRVVFDDQRVVANAGVMLPSLLAGRLGLEALIDRTVDLGGRPGAANPGRKGGAGPGDDQLVVDVDSFVGEVYGYDKQGAGYGYTHRRGYHPIIATRAGTGEVLHIRARKGSANTSRGALRFVEELIPRVA